MSIKEKGYTHWDGKLKESRFPWWPITRLGIRLTFKKKFFKFFFFLSLSPALAYLVGIYVSERMEEFRFMVQESVSFLQINPNYFKSYLTGDFLYFMIILILVFAASGLISDDLRHNSLQLYFSRPLKKRDYFMGKSSVIVFFLFILTMIPSLVLFLMKLIFSGSFKFFSTYPWLPLSIIGYSLLLTVFFSFYALFLSSLSPNRRYVAVLILGFYFFSDILFGIFQGIFHSHYFSLLSIKSNLQQVGALFFQQKTPYEISWVFSLLVLLGVCVLSALVLRKKVQGVRIIK